MSEPPHKSQKILKLREELRAAKNHTANTMMLDAIPRAELDAALKQIEVLEAEVAQLRAALATRKRRPVKDNTEKSLVAENGQPHNSRHLKPASR